VADYKEVARRWFSEVMSEGKTEVIDELCARISSTTARSPERAPISRV
jgi:hypothetical protein